AILVGEDRDQAAVAGIEVEVALGGVVEIRLLEYEWHPEHPLPEVDRCLPAGSDNRDVVDALNLKLSHDSPIARSAWTCTRCAEGCPTARGRRWSARSARFAPAP